MKEPRHMQNQNSPKEKVHWKGSVLLAPVPPVMVTVGTMEDANILTVGWTGIVCTHPPMTYISVRPSRHSYTYLQKYKEFAIHLTPAHLVREADFCGMYTGKKVDKFEKCHFDKEAAQAISCPLIAQAPLSLECKVTQILPLGTHDLFLSEIVAVNADPALLDDSGKLDLSRANLAAYAHGEYFALGKKLGTFGFSAAKNAPSRRRQSNPKKSKNKA